MASARAAWAESARLARRSASGSPPAGSAGALAGGSVTNSVVLAAVSDKHAHRQIS